MNHPMQWTHFRAGLNRFSDADLKRIEEAFALGKRAHEGQKRKSGEPYFDHPVTVARMLADIGADADTIIAALLHDTLEDTVLALPDIERAFGKTVAELVDGVTKIVTEELEERPSLNEQTETLRKIFRLMQKDVRIMIIKLVDRLHNMNTASFLSEDRRILLARETLDVYVKIADRLSMRAIRDELHALCLEVLEPEMHKKLVALRTKNEERGHGTMQKMKKTMHGANAEIADALELHYEHKRWDKLREQAEIESAAATGQAALVVVFVCLDTDACYRTMGLLHQLWRRETMSFQDFINSPMINGYKGLHTTVILEDGTRVRCKIRTPAMHRYAETGVTNFCFTGEAKGLLDYLPWTQRISSLASSTANRSEEFWDSLQSDIFGESIVVHGPGDQTILVPAGATALDGAFYLFGKEATHTTSVHLDGVEVPFHSPLHHAVSLDITTAKTSQVQREWLNFVRTWIALANIRNALQKNTDEHKISAGKSLLQNILQQRKRGFVEEFREESLTEKLKKLGYSSLRDVYIAIADGRLDPEEIESILFAKDIEAKQHCIISYYLDPDDLGLLAQAGQLQKHYRDSVEDVRYIFSKKSEKGFVKARMFITPAEQHIITSGLRTAGAKNVKVEYSQSKLLKIFILSGLIILWGMDPVFARVILQGSPDAFDLTFIRFAVLLICAAFASVIQLYLHRNQKLQPLSPFKMSLFLSGITLYGTALCSYLTLTYLPATQYILYIIAGLGIAGLFKTMKQKSLSFVPSLIGVIALCSGIIFLTRLERFSLVGSLLAIGSSFGFVLYARVSKQYLQETAAVSVRYPIFLFWISLLGTGLSLLFLPLGTMRAIPQVELLFAFLFVLIFSALPYFLFFEAQRRIEQVVLDRTLPLVVLANIAGEIFMKGSLRTLFVIPFLLCFFFLSAFKPTRRKV